ncbi:DUF6783 domain-containing protein [Lachnotalea sp. AF33-28]
MELSVFDNSFPLKCDAYLTKSNFQTRSETTK